MDNLRKGKYVVLGFASVKSIVTNKKTGVRIGFGTPRIIEISAVKVENGKISDSYSRFVAIEGHDPHGIEFYDIERNLCGVRPVHLIGAKSFQEEVERLHCFVKDCVLIMHDWHIKRAFQYVKNFAHKRGLDFHNEVVDLIALLMAYHLKINLSVEEFENASAMEISKYIELYEDSWKELFFENDVAFDPSRKDIPSCRDDNLGWALAFAELLIKLQNDLYPDEESNYQLLDEELPF